jgi:hypothetical protein
MAISDNVFGDGPDSSDPLDPVDRALRRALDVVLDEDVDAVVLGTARVLQALILAWRARNMFPGLADGLFELAARFDASLPTPPRPGGHLRRIK